VVLENTHETSERRARQGNDAIPIFERLERDRKKGKVILRQRKRKKMNYCENRVRKKSFSVLQTEEASKGRGRAKAVGKAKEYVSRFSKHQLKTAKIRGTKFWRNRDRSHRKKKRRGKRVRGKEKKFA